MTRHWRKTAIAIAGTALVASAVGSAASASTPPYSGAGGAITGYDESAKCNTPEYTGNLAKLEAPDPYTVVMTLCNPDVAIPAKVAFASLGINSSDQLTDTDGLINNPIGTGPYMLGSGTTAARSCSTPTPTTGARRRSRRRRCSSGTARARSASSACSPAPPTPSTTSAPTTSPRWRATPTSPLVERSPLNVAYLGFNVDTPPFDNEKVRQAIGYPRPAAPRRQLLPEGLRGRDAVPAAGDPRLRRGLRRLHLRHREGQAAARRAGYRRRAQRHAELPRRGPRLRRPADPGGDQTSRPSWPQSASTSPSTSRSRRRSSTTRRPARCRSSCSAGAPTSRTRPTSGLPLHRGVQAARHAVPRPRRPARQAGQTTDEAAAADLYAQANALHPAARAAGADRLRRFGDGLPRRRGRRPRPARSPASGCR